MVEAAQRIHPLAKRVFGGNGVFLNPLEECERISLRADQDAMAGLGEKIGLSLPEQPRTSATSGEVAALWIGPDEWFITAPAGTGLEEKLNTSDSGLYSVVSIDHRNTGILVSGSNAVTALNSGSPRDLSLDAFPVGCCSRTVLAKAEIILWRTGEEEFRIECWRSFSDYVWKYLVDAARSV
ncbi:MAG: sarcosine oxidase subunit gamma [Pseudomonadota bacterium]